MSFLGIKPKEDVSLLRNNIISTYTRYEAEKYLGYKNNKLEITDDGFVRYRKVFSNNKSEYYSVRISRLLEVKYQGTEKSGWLLINCEPSSVIFQTYKDPSGDVDSMANEIVFPVKNISVEELNALKSDFESLKRLFSL